MIIIVFFLVIINLFLWGFAPRRNPAAALTG